MGVKSEGSQRARGDALKRCYGNGFFPRESVEEALGRSRARRSDIHQIYDVFQIGDRNHTAEEVASMTLCATFFCRFFFETSKWHLAYATDGEAVKNRCLFLGQGVFQGSRAAGGSVGVVVPDLSPRRLSCRNVGLLFKSTHLSAGWQPLKRRILVEGQGLREVRLRRR